VWTLLPTEDPEGGGCGGEDKVASLTGSLPHPYTLHFHFLPLQPPVLVVGPQNPSTSCGYRRGAVEVGNLKLENLGGPDKEDSLVTSLALPASVSFQSFSPVTPRDLRHIARIWETLKC
jgi:hypothetical protein